MIYISYSHKDIAMVRALEEHLNQQGYAVGNDSEVNSDKLRLKTLTDIIRKCDVYIILITKNCLESMHMFTEVSFALQEAQRRDKMVLLVAFTREIIGLTTKWALSLRRYQWIDCDSMSPDWIEVVSDVVAKVYGNEQRKIAVFRTMILKC